jgi:DNA invertase Pin-like site-specific DNA recombinase
MNSYLGYIRVSTARQGERGVSLQEQRDAITRYAERHELRISRWFEERETAAKRGRPIFNEMLRLLRNGKAEGVMIHKIDRSARNMRDWAELGELIDKGVEVHFVNESLDLASRGGRLSADIQAVVASDYIRNLREESRKGFYGRIKQGFFPLPAPLGYRDMGKAKPKELDPARAPLVRRAFELYSTANWNLHQLKDELHQLGLRNRNGGPVSVNGLSTMLNNPFYIGLIRLTKTGEVFPGVHVPLIGKSLFDRVQLVLRGKVNARAQTHDFQFRRLLRCATCNFALIGELQKGHVYYRCHTKACPTTSVREETVEGVFADTFESLYFDKDERAIVAEELSEMKEDLMNKWESQTNAMRLRLAQLKERLDRLTDAYIDRLIDRQTFETRKASILEEEKALQEKISQPRHATIVRLKRFLELAGDAYLLYKSTLANEKRDLVRIATSNRKVSEKNVVITLKPPFQEVANRFDSTNCRAYRDRPRTLKKMLYKLADWFTANPEVEFETSPIFSNEYYPGDEDLNVGDHAA